MLAKLSAFALAISTSTIAFAAPVMTSGSSTVTVYTNARHVAAADIIIEGAAAEALYKGMTDVPAVPEMYPAPEGATPETGLVKHGASMSCSFSVTYSCYVKVNDATHGSLN